MDISTAASGLRDLLVAHINTQIQLSLLDEQNTSISQGMLLCSMGGSRSQQLHLVLRLSVSEGVRHMYMQYENKTWQQVQQKASSIALALESDDSDSEQTSPMRSRSSAPSISNDKAVEVWSSAFCEFCRDR